MMRNTLIVLVVAGLLGTTLQAVADQQSCPAVNCDCTSLPREAWQDYCYAHELRIKKSCVANNNVPNEYCSLHGPGATPLPLALKAAESPVLSKDIIPEAQQNLVKQFRAMDSEISLLRNKVSSLWFAESINILKKMDETLDQLYQQQIRVSSSWLVYEDEGEARSTWNEFAKSSEPLAEIWREYGDLVWDMYLKEASPQAKQAYRVIAFRVIRLSGKAYEMAATGFGHTGKFKRAAKTWSVAADVAKVVMQHKTESGAPASHVTFYSYQASSRLHRATYYWALEANEDNVLQALAQAQELSGKDDMHQLLIAAEERKDEESVQTVGN